MILGWALLFVFIWLVQFWGIRKSFCIYFVFMLLDTGIPLLPGFATLSFALAVFFFAIFFIKRKNYKKEKYPLIGYSVLYAISMVLSAYFSKLNPHWIYVFKTLIMELLVPVLFYYFVNDEKTCRYLIRIFVVGVFFVMINAGVELVTGEAYIQNIISKFRGDGGALMVGVMRYGMKRCQSVFLHSTSFGYFCATLFSFFLLSLYSKDVRRKVIPSRKYRLVLFLLLIGIFLSGTRSAMLLPIFPLVYVYSLHARKDALWAIVVGSAVMIVAVFLGGETFSMIVDSIVNSDAHGGSSSSMREAQFAIAMEYWSKSPFLGYGPSSTFDYFVLDNWRLLGAESVWLPILLDYGALGCVSYLWGYFSIFKLYSGKRMLLFVFLLAVLLANTMTSVPGLRFNFIICLGFLLQRMHQYYLKKNEGYDVG